MRTTIKMIAERAGVSIGTVDRVLHDRPYVKVEVRERVLRVMEELDYHPHNSDDLPLLGEEAEDRISVFGVLKNNAMYRALPADQFFHDFLSLTCRCSPSCERPLTGIFISRSRRPAGSPPRSPQRRCPPAPPDSRQGPWPPPSGRSRQ